MIGLGNLIEVSQQTECAPLLQVRAFDLCCGRRIAGDGSGFKHGHGGGTATACHGTVLPGVTVFFNQLFKHINRFGLTTGGPPMHHFNRAFGIGRGGGISTQGE